MRFWESSAIVPLIVPERTTVFCQRLVKADPYVVVWSLAGVEVHSALSRKYREGSLDKKKFDRAKSRRKVLMQGFSEILQYELVKKRCYRLLEIHFLRAADALHLAAAIVAFEEDIEGVEFVTFDQRLGEAAEREGFKVLGPDQL